MNDLGFWRWCSLGAALATVAAACAGPTSPTVEGGGQSSALSRTAPKRIVAVVSAQYPILITRFERTLEGAEAVEVAIASGLTVKSHRGEVLPILAEQVPTLENGLWKLFPDGRMETTWTLRANAVWHDGQPLTTDDLLFTARVGQDEALSAFRHTGYAKTSSIEAVDSRTIIVGWNSPFIDADTLFTNDFNGRLILFPLPKHLLERQYIESKEGFTQLRFWADEFVGSGPFKLKEWVPGQLAVLAANEQFVLGRPKVDELEIRFAGDTQTAIANLLAGAADLTLGRGASIEEGVNAAARWPEGRMENIALKSAFALFPQFINPSPAVIANLQFRRALMHSIDRQTMTDVLQLGQVPAAHSYLAPDNPMFPAIEPLLVKYEFDSRKAVQMIEDLGYARGPDGMFRDAQSERLVVEERMTPGELYDRVVATVRDYWQAVGVGVEITPIPRQRQTDREYRSTRPGFELTRRGTDLSTLRSFQSREAPLPETRFVGSNVPRYMNAEFDALIDRYFVTVPIPERTAAVGQIMRHISDQLNMMHIFYDSEPSLIANRLINVYPKGSDSTQTWNAWEWDVR